MSEQMASSEAENFSDASVDSENGGSNSDGDSEGDLREHSHSPGIPARKRKRESDEPEVPKKKKAIVNRVRENSKSASPLPKDKSTNTVEYVEGDERCIPVIAFSPALSIPSKASFTKYYALDTKELLLHSSDNSKLDFIARQHEKQDMEGQVRHYMAIHDPTKEKIQIIEAKLLSMRSIVRAEDKGVSSPESPATPNDITIRNRLGLEFGNKKAKKAIESSSQNRITTITQLNGVDASPEAIKTAIQANPSAMAVIDSMAESAQAAPAKEVVQADADRSKPRPKHNPEATEPEQHYPLSELIGDDVMRGIKVRAWFDTIDDGGSVTPNSRFVAHRLKPIINEGADGAVAKVRVLKWMSMLIALLDLRREPKNGSKMPKMSKIIERTGEPSSLVGEMVTQFGGDNGEMRKWHVDYLISHLCVMSLFVDDFKTDTYDLKEDLQLDAKQLTTHFREIGAKVGYMTDKEREGTKLTRDEAKLHRVASLGKSLDFPQLRQRLAQRRG